MNKKKRANKEIKRLRTLLKFYNYCYHTLDDPRVSDYEFDMLYQKLKKLEEEYPEFYDSESPTQKVGGYFTIDKLSKT
jgi:DNA ligase (NAD+)